MEEFDFEEADICDGLDVLQMLHEIGPGENGFQKTYFTRELQE